MKLGILCTMINGFGRRGYYNSQEVGLGRALAAMGHELTIYKGIDPSEEEEKVVVVPGLVVWYLPMRHLGAHGWMPVSALDAETKALFCFGDQQLFLPHIYRWCKRHGAAFVPYIGTAHSLNDGPKGRLMNILFETGTLRIYKNNPVLAKTSAAKAELEALGVERITVAPVGLDTSVLKQDFRSVDRDALRREHGYAPEDVVLCNVSRLSPEKRPLELIDLFLKIRGKKPFKLIIVGNGTLENALKEKIHFNGLEQEVTLYENVPYPEMWKIYCMSDYYVNMNKGEIFGMAIMEAVYYCTSVAAYRAIGPSVTLKDMKGHALCDDDDVIAQWLLAPYPSRQELEESAAKVARDFSWERCARAFLDIVQNASNSDVKCVTEDDHYQNTFPDVLLWRRNGHGELFPRIWRGCALHDIRQILLCQRPASAALLFLRDGAFLRKDRAGEQPGRDRASGHPERNEDAGYASYPADLRGRPSGAVRTGDVQLICRRDAERILRAERAVCQQGKTGQGGHLSGAGALRRGRRLAGPGRGGVRRLQPH